MDALRNSYSNSRMLALRGIELELQHMERTKQGLDHEFHLYARIGGMICLAKSAGLIKAAEKEAFEARLEVAGPARMSYR